MKKQVNEDIYNVLKYLKSQEDIEKLIINDDIEFDYGCLAISGVVIKSNNYIYPIAGGFDLGCGIGMFVSDIKLSEGMIFDLDYTNSRPFGINKKKYNCIEKETIFNGIDNIYIGDIEKGNHFIEIRNYNGYVAILIHCGICEMMRSEFAMYFFRELRKFDESILKTFNPYLFRVSSVSDIGKELLYISNEANNYSKMNRKYIANQIIHMLGGKITVSVLFKGVYN